MDNKWIDAGIILGNNPTAKVTCPECNHNYLDVSDVYIAGEKSFERFLVCPRCKERSILRMKYEG